MAIIRWKLIDGDKHILFSAHEDKYKDIADDLGIKKASEKTSTTQVKGNIRNNAVRLIATLEPNDDSSGTTTDSKISSDSVVVWASFKNLATALAIPSKDGKVYGRKVISIAPASRLIRSN